jgi:hypothetical protein
VLASASLNSLLTRQPDKITGLTIHILIMDKSKGADGLWIEEADTSVGTAGPVKVNSPENTDGFKKMVKKSSTTTVIIAGIALFSDGYTAQISKLLPS